ncbi:MAG: hypothetical protein GEU99_07440 [Luteitalea sp.]|nr:hypothetical protein [Luteitalea sp.]
MSTNVNVFECPDKASLVTLLYAEGSETDERRRLEGHLLVCEACAAELNGLRSVRGALAHWTAPNVPLGFRVVREFAAKPARRWRGAAPLAAAAVLVLAAAAALANLEVRVDADGLTVKTGWSDSREDTAQSASARASEEGGTAPWRADLATFKEELRRELAAGPVSATSRSAPSASARSTVNDEQAAADRASADLLRRVRVLIDRSETRQQEQLAAQISDLATQFQIQRREDLVYITQSLGRLESRQGVDQRMLNNFVRVVSAHQSVP